MATTTMIHVRVDEQVKAKAAANLAAMGLSVSDAVRMLLVRVATEQALPFEIRAPNAETITAIQELEAGVERGSESVEALMADLNADD
ncbi:MAG: type II toxin-antitoxin system RelB/DinJ family antitoxin [Chromatiales bacterium]|nr:type II toxin-antitoxin system RelB/DinJ family antitoxin [Chromatiales bacterium]